MYCIFEFTQNKNIMKTALIICISLLGLFTILVLALSIDQVFNHRRFSSSIDYYFREKFEPGESKASIYLKPYSLPSEYKIVNNGRYFAVQKKDEGLMYSIRGSFKSFSKEFDSFTYLFNTYEEAEYCILSYLREENLKNLKTSDFK